LTRRRRREPARVPIEKACAHLLFRQQQTAADGRLREIELFSSADRAAGASQRQHELESAHIESGFWTSYAGHASMISTLVVGRIEPRHVDSCAPTWRAPDAAVLFTAGLLDGVAHRALRERCRSRVR